MRDRRDESGAIRDARDLQGGGTGAALLSQGGDILERLPDTHLAAQIRALMHAAFRLEAKGD